MDHFICTDDYGNSVLLSADTIDGLSDHGCFCGVIYSHWDDPVVEVVKFLSDNQVVEDIDDCEELAYSVYCICGDCEKACKYENGLFECPECGNVYREQDVRADIESTFRYLYPSILEHSNWLSNEQYYNDYNYQNDDEDEDEDSWEEYDEDWD